MNISLRISSLSPLLYAGKLRLFHTIVMSTVSEVAKLFFLLIDCSQSPIPLEGRRDGALCVTDGHLDFKCTEGTSVGCYRQWGGGVEGGKCFSRRPPPPK